MSDLTKQFEREHFTLNSISEQRRQQVRVGIARLEAYLSRPIETITPNELRSWLVTQLEDGLAPSTVGLYLGMVMPFYRWCWLQGTISADDYMRLREVSAPRGGKATKPRPYSRKELTRFYAQLDARWPLLHPIPDRVAGGHPINRYRKGTTSFHSVLRKHAMRLQLDAMIELALVCGLRRVEIYRLSIDDLHFDNKYVVVHGKRHDQNDKTREVPYGPSTREAVRAWFRFRGYMSPPPGLGVWLSITGPDPVAELSMFRMAEILRSFGRWEFHRLRHTCATERLRAGMSLEMLQKFLGHSDISMTQRYTQLLRDDVHKASERVDEDFQRAIGRAA